LGKVIFWAWRFLIHKNIFPALAVAFFKISVFGFIFFSRQVFKFSAFSLAVFSPLAKVQVGFVQSLKLVSRFLAGSSVCGGFDWLCFVASFFSWLAL